MAVGGRTLRIVRPRDPEALLDEGAFEHEEFLPYWAELWPASLALARALAAEEDALRSARVLELGCGLGIPSIYAALSGADALATDWSEDALTFARRNAALNGVDVETVHLRWDEPSPVFGRAPWDLVMASDVLYESRNGEQLLELLPRLAEPGGAVLLAEPGRPAAAAFLAAAEAAWHVEHDVDEVSGIALYRLARR